MAAIMLFLLLIYPLSTIARAPRPFGVLASVQMAATRLSTLLSSHQRQSSNQFEWPVFFYAASDTLQQDTVAWRPCCIDFLPRALLPRRPDIDHRCLA
jgi:hypothetical protein